MLQSSSIVCLVAVDDVEEGCVDRRRCAVRGLFSIPPATSPFGASGYPFWTERLQGLSTDSS